MPSWLEHPRSPDEPDEPDEPRYGARTGQPPGPAEDHYANGSTEFHGAGPVPDGFGFRTGMRSARTVLGFAWFVLVMAIYVIVVYFAAPRTPDYGASWWAWPMQPGAPDSSWICATILVITGAVAYGRRGPAPTTSTGERQRSLA